MRDGRKLSAFDLFFVFTSSFIIHTSSFLLHIPAVDIGILSVPAFPSISAVAD
jgi:hypothetical protein